MNARFVLALAAAVAAAAVALRRRRQSPAAPIGETGTWSAVPAPASTP